MTTAVTKKHKNSRIVTIFPTYNNLPFIFDVKDKEYKEWKPWAEQGLQGISAVYRDNSNPRRWLTGLDVKTERLLLAEFFGDDVKEENRRAFETFKNEFYSAMHVFIPFNGKDFEIGLEVDNDADVSFDNLPINLSDYLVYKALIERNTEIAPNQDHGAAVKHYRFYIEDKQLIRNTEEVRAKLLFEASQHFQKIINDPVQLRKFLYLMGSAPKENAEVYQLANELDALLRQRPKEFIDHVNDKDSDARGWVRMLVTYNVYKVDGPTGQYVDLISNTTIAKDEKEAIRYFKDEINAHPEEIQRAKQALAEKRAKAKELAQG